MLFNLRWENNKQKIEITISDCEEGDDYILIKPDLTNAFNKKIVKKIFKKISTNFVQPFNYEINVDNESFIKASIDYKILNNVKTLELILKELIEDIIYELKHKTKPVYV